MLICNILIEQRYKVYVFKIFYVLNYIIYYYVEYFIALLNIM